MLSDGGHSPTLQVLQLLQQWERSPPTHHLLPHPARGCYFHRGRSLTLRIIAHSCVERLREKQKPHIAFKRQIQSKGTWILMKFTLEII